MPARRIERVSRGRKLTPQEAARYRQLRAEIESEKPAIDAQIRAQLAEQRELAAVFAELLSPALEMAYKPDAPARDPLLALRASVPLAT